MVKNGNISTEEKILTAAKNEFAALGYAGSRVDSIAEKARVNKAMIYYHFKSKEVLYERILKDLTSNIFRQIQEAAIEEGDPLEVLYSVISRYITILNLFDREFFQIMLREIASGGKHFRKIAIPNLVVPVFSLIGPLINSAMANGKMRELNPQYTFLQIIGSIVFFNVIRIPMQDSELEKIIFKEGYLEEFKENLFKVLKHGLELKDGNV